MKHCKGGGAAERPYRMMEVPDSQNWNAHRARKTQTMKKNKRKISLFNECNFGLVDYTYEKAA